MLPIDEPAVQRLQATLEHCPTQLSKAVKEDRKYIDWEPKTIDETSREELLQIQLFKVNLYLHSKEEYNNLLFFLSGNYHIEFYYLSVEFIDHETIEIYRKIIEKLGSRVACIEGMYSDGVIKSLMDEVLWYPASDKLPFDIEIDKYMIREGKVAASSYCFGEACTEVFEYCLQNDTTVYQWRCCGSKSQLVDISQYLRHSELFSFVKRMEIYEEYIIGDESLKILSKTLDFYPNIDLKIYMGDKFGIDRVMRYTDLAVYSLQLSAKDSLCSSFKSYCPVVLFKSTNEKKMHMKFKWVEANYDLDDTNIRGSVLIIYQINSLVLTGGSKLADCTMYDDEAENFEDQQMIMDTRYIYQCQFQCYRNKDIQPYPTIFKLLQPHVKVGLGIWAKKYLTECEWLVELVMHPPPLLYRLRLDFETLDCDHMMELLVACKLVNFEIPDRGKIRLDTKKEYYEHYKDEKLALKNKKEDPVDEQSVDEQSVETVRVRVQAVAEQSVGVQSVGDGKERLEEEKSNHIRQEDEIDTESLNSWLIHMRLKRKEKKDKRQQLENKKKRICQIF